MYDRELSHFGEQLTRDVATGEVIPNEGMVLVWAEESGNKKVKRSVGAAHETVAGFSIIDNYQPGVEIKVESGVVPAAGAFTVNLSHGNIVAGQIRIADVTAGIDLVLVPAGPGEPAATHYTLNTTSGLVTFNAAEAGHTIAVFYKYNMTLAESIGLYHERHANAGASAFLEVVEVGAGNGEIYTDQYDVSKNYNNLTVGQLTTSNVAGQEGLITVGGAGPVVGIVLHAPDSSGSPSRVGFLGVKFTMANVQL